MNCWCVPVFQTVRVQDPPIGLPAAVSSRGQLQDAHERSWSQQQQALKPGVTDWCAQTPLTGSTILPLTPYGTQKLETVVAHSWQNEISLTQDYCLYNATFSLIVKTFDPEVNIVKILLSRFLLIKCHILLFCRNCFTHIFIIVL